MAEINLTKENFEKEVLRSDKPVLVDFWAPWCAPCRMLAPAIKEISEEYSNIKVGKVNIDEQQELAVEYNVASIPMVVLYKDGKPVDAMVGFRPKAQIAAMFK